MHRQRYAWGHPWMRRTTTLYRSGQASCLCGNSHWSRSRTNGRRRRLLSRCTCENIPAGTTDVRCGATIQLSTSNRSMAMSYEDELREILNEAAKSISDAESNPRTWLAWIVYLLARLEEKATNENPFYKEAYIEMLAALQDEVRNRMRTGGWH